MAGLVAVDTDLLIDFLRGRGEGVAAVRTLLVERRLRLTAVSAFELRVGTDFLERGPEILRLFRSRTLSLDLQAGLRAGEVASNLTRTGRPIGMADCLQAGICMRHDLPFLTRNRKHFDRVEGLRLVDLEPDLG
ncbi:MAG TPA: type II toxin-antitoxin system VapC family toxin [Pseudonocardia sp.]|jgi:tRNA(fMet)-specific endonuclease VapC